MLEFTAIWHQFHAERRRQALGETGSESVCAETFCRSEPRRHERRRHERHRGKKQSIILGKTSLCLGASACLRRPALRTTSGGGSEASASRRQVVNLLLASGRVGAGKSRPVTCQLRDRRGGEGRRPAGPQGGVLAGESAGGALRSLGGPASARRVLF